MPADSRSLPRKLPLILGLSLAVALLAVPASALEDPALRTQVTVLENGLTILALVDPSSPVVSFQMWVRVGSRDESRYTGIAHLFEHMMFKGSKNVPPEAHATLLEARGGRINAFTSNDVTVYFEDVTSENLPLVIELEAERLANLDISEKTLASERQVVLEERRFRTEDSPQGRAMEALFALTFQAHPYRWPVIGWRSDVEEVTVEACRRFFRAYYAPNNIVVAVVGDFDGDDLLKRMEQSFGALEPVAEIPRNPTREPEQRGERRSIVHFDLRGPILAAAWHAPASGHEDGPALDVASQILSAGRSSRLYRRLVHGEQQALSARGGYWELMDAGMFFAFAGVRPDASIDRVESLFLEEIGRLRDEPVEDAELRKAKIQLEVDLVNSLGTNHAVASRLGRDYVTFGRIRPLEELLTGIRAVTAADVQRVASRYLVDDQRSVVRVVAGPPAPDAEAGR